MIQCLDSKTLPYLSPYFGLNSEAHKVEDAQQRSQPTSLFHVTYLETDSGTHGRGETFFYQAVRDKDSVKLRSERHWRMGKKSVGVQALLNVPADGQTWAFSY